MKSILFILAVVGTVSAFTPKNPPQNNPNDPDSDRFIHVDEVHAPRILATTNKHVVKKAKFSYLPNSGENKNEAIVIKSFNCISGGYAESVLLRVLFGMHEEPTDSSYIVESYNGKEFHIFSIKTRDGNTKKIYFDATAYHGIY